MQSFHNPRNLPPAGEFPWRFFLVSELECLPEDAQVWDNVNLFWKDSCRAGKEANFRFFTYRTQKPLPVEVE